ncbi:MAG: hypothetical protein ACON38_17385 [Akkermansiaceae bacterium]
MKKFLVLMSAGVAFALASCAAPQKSCCGTCGGGEKKECCGTCGGDKKSACGSSKCSGCDADKKQ